MANKEWRRPEQTQKRWIEGINTFGALPWLPASAHCECQSSDHHTTVNSFLISCLRCKTSSCWSRQGRYSFVHAVVGNQSFYPTLNPPTETLTVSQQVAPTACVLHISTIRPLFGAFFRFPSHLSAGRVDWLTITLSGQFWFKPLISKLLVIEHYIRRQVVGWIKYAESAQKEWDKSDNVAR